MATRPGRALIGGLMVACLLGAPVPAPAEEWGGIEPGVTTLEEVRARYGAPSKETRGKLEDRDTTRWIYEAARAPAGIKRMIVDYGLLTPRGYQPTVVRVFQLEPKPLIFGKNTVGQAWGTPDGLSNQDGHESFFYRSGLVVTFNQEGTDSIRLVFTPPQPTLPPDPAAPRR